LLTNEFSTSSARIGHKGTVKAYCTPSTKKKDGRMRLMIGALLLASVAAVPAMAQDRPHDGQHQSGGDHGDHGGDHGGDRGGGHEAHGDGGDHGGGGGGGHGGGAPQVQVHTPAPQQARPDFQRPDHAQGGGGFGGDHGGGGAGFQPHGNAPDGGHRVYGRPDNGVQVWRNDRGNAQRPDWSNRPADQQGGWDRNHDGRPDDNRFGGGDRNHDGRPDWQNGNRGRPGDWSRDHGGGWNNGWRNDRRYDWQGWRNTHRDFYRVGPYRTPYGYGGGYRRWGIGVRIDPIFFAQDYWISDPDYYRLPPAYGSYRWVRYYNDALLVNIYSGTVVDEIPDFFW
jgi:Ni/Co efflux regulator RcnB